MPKNCDSNIFENILNRCQFKVLQLKCKILAHVLYLKIIQKVCINRCHKSPLESCTQLKEVLKLFYFYYILTNKMVWWLFQYMIYKHFVSIIQKVSIIIQYVPICLLNKFTPLYICESPNTVLCKYLLKG